MKYAGRNTAQIKILNKEMIRECLKAAGYATNAEIARKTGLSISTCSNTLNELLEHQEVIISESIESNGGRPARVYHYNEEFEYKLCIFAHRTDRINTLYYVLCNAAGKELESDLVEKDEITADVFFNLIHTLTEKYPKISVIGIGLPGIIHDGVVCQSDIKNLEGLALGKMIRDRFHVFVRIGNDMNYKAYGFWRNMEADEDTPIAYVTFPGEECPGCGIVVNGKVLGGVTGFAGEIQYLFKGENQSETNVQLTNSDDIIDMATHILIPLVSIVNPKIVALTGSLMKDEFVDEIYRRCTKVIPQEYFAKLIFRKDNTRDYIRGLVDLTSALRLEGELK